MSVEIDKHTLESELEVEHDQNRWFCQNTLSLDYWVIFHASKHKIFKNGHSTRCQRMQNKKKY